MRPARYICAGEISSIDPSKGSQGSQKQIPSGIWASEVELFIFRIFLLFLTLDSHLPRKLCFCLIESPLTSYFIIKTIFVLKIFKFLSKLFGHVEKAADQKDKVNFKIHDVRAYLTNSCNTYIAQYLMK